MPTENSEMMDELRCEETGAYRPRLAAAMKESSKVVSLLKPILPIVNQVLKCLDEVPGVDHDLYNLMKPLKFPYLCNLQEDQLICQDKEVEKFLNRFNKSWLPCTWGTTQVGW